MEGDGEKEERAEEAKEEVEIKQKSIDPSMMKVVELRGHLLLDS